ncbi:hypothetical protein [Xanthovirga aplysinae]|uniref:hypothetical protein n=1 Tax=Xanthovirga aplysinae TaxID=2529853 RepID=UPI0012BCB800|nr:hypothetical protein [Xanthovirga aplysinae]MTI32151.1 hypothetical protein [Xanthovirga aplysinae]
MKTNLLSILFFIFSTSFSQGQDITGFWEITNVTVGEEIMTPVAKWTKIKADHTFVSGNGWEQNAEGTYSYDEKTQQYNPQNKNWLKDPAGPFTVSFLNGKMIWEREEEGNKVVITLRRVVKMPMGPVDKIRGLWALTNSTINGEEVNFLTVSNSQPYIFIRPDRLYRQRSERGEVSSGYWFMHAHRHELTFISHKEEEERKKWALKFKDDQLILIGLSKGNKDLQRTYKRIDEFPQ